MKKNIYLIFTFILLIAIFNLNAIKIFFNFKKVVLPHDVQSISSELITIDVQASAKIILKSDYSNLNDSLVFIEHLQKEISTNQIQIGDVFFIVSDVTDVNRNEIILFLEKNNIFLQTIIDSDKRIEKQFDMNTAAGIYVIYRNKLIWNTTNLFSLKTKNLKDLIRP